LAGPKKIGESGLPIFHLRTASRATVWRGGGKKPRQRFRFAAVKKDSFFGARPPCTARGTPRRRAPPRPTPSGSCRAVWRTRWQDQNENMIFVDMKYESPALPS
jgi:hypothetical protein